MLTPRGPVERDTVQISVPAEVQDNGDGTWTAVIWTSFCCDPVCHGPFTATTREAALKLAADSIST